MTAKIYHWRFARETLSETRERNLKPKSGLIAVDPRSVDRKLREAKPHLPSARVSHSTAPRLGPRRAAKGG